MKVRLSGDRVTIGLRRQWAASERPAPGAVALTPVPVFAEALAT